MIADAHMHLFERGWTRLGPDLPAYELLLARHQIAAALVVGYQSPDLDPTNNAYIRRLAATRPWMTTLAYADPAEVLFPDAASAILDAGHAGLALYLRDAAHAAAVSSWPSETWRVLSRANAIISLNSPPPASDLAIIIAANPACSFLFSHLGLPSRHRLIPSPAEARQNLAPLLALAALPNVFVKISGLYAISEPAHAWPHAAAAPFIALILDAFTPARCLWASDFAPALGSVSFDQTIDNSHISALTSAEREAIMGANLLRLLG